VPIFDFRFSIFDSHEFRFSIFGPSGARAGGLAGLCFCERDNEDLRGPGRLNACDLGALHLEF